MNKLYASNTLYIQDIVRSKYTKKHTINSDQKMSTSLNKEAHKKDVENSLLKEQITENALQLDNQSIDTDINKAETQEKNTVESQDNPVEDKENNKAETQGN